MIFIILPAYNEELSLGILLKRIRLTMESFSVRYEVIVVNDGSTDGTLEGASREAAVMPLKVISHGTNKGLGVALRSGLQSVNKRTKGGDVVVVMDADLTHPPDLICLMVSKLTRDYDLVIASRYVDGAKVVGLKFTRRLLSMGSNAMLRVLFPMRGIKDYTSGYRGYKAEIIKEAFAKYGNMFVQEEEFACMVDVLLKLRRLGVCCHEVPLVLRYDQKKGASKLRVLRTIFRYLVLIAQNFFTPKSKLLRKIPAESH